MREILKVNFDDIKDEILRERARIAHNDRSQEFVAVIDNEEVGFLCYEDWRHQSTVFIYEIFVLPKFRRKGVGASFVSFAEELAVALGCSCIRLQARALDQEIDPKWLFSWYENMGYVKESGDSEYLRKSVKKMA